ncbi:hypothetical protein Tco_1112091 [Tanacetum coccineum]|uniref:Uncharacterized protein n=1 Tax=Tanacetum coccineum TaxID=301880 RepID=A0ABQ5IR62_9ASTR
MTQRLMIKIVHRAIGEKVDEVKEEEQVKRTGKRKKQKARKGINVDKSAQEDSETDKEESVEAMNPTPLTIKSDTLELRLKTSQERMLYRTMFDPPLIEDPIWSLPFQQKMFITIGYRLSLENLSREAAPGKEVQTGPPAPMTAKQLTANKNQEELKASCLLDIHDGISS